MSENRAGAGIGGETDNMNVESLTAMNTFVHNVYKEVKCYVS